MQNIQTSGMSQNGTAFVNQAKEVDKLPDECPVCGFTIVPQLFVQAWLAIDVLEVFSRCANPKCSRSFISLYRYDAGLSQGKATQSFKFERSLPIEAKRHDTSPEIATLSPSFVRIAAQ